MLVVSQGWAKVKELGQQKVEASAYLTELMRLEEQAKQQGLGKWSKASEASIRNLPPSAVGDSANFDALGLLSENKGRSMPAVVEQVRNGSTIRVYLLPEFQFVQVFMAGIQSPSMGRRAAPDTVAPVDQSPEHQNGETAAEPRGQLTSAQRVSAGDSTEVAPEPFGREAKHFTETRVLHRDVRIVLEGVDKYNNVIGSVYYNDGNEAKNLAMELVTSGLALMLSGVQE